MLPPGLSFNAVSEKALAASKTVEAAQAVLVVGGDDPAQQERLLPLYAGTNLLYGLDDAIDMLNEEGLDNVFARHDRHAEATRRAVRAWGLEILCRGAASTIPRR